MISKRILFFILFFLFWGVSSFADTPMDTIKKVYSLLSQYDEKKPGNEALKKEINQYFLLHEMARNAIKDHWPKMSAKQQNEYISLMFQLLEKAVYRDTQENLQKGKITYKNQRIQGNRATVLTRIYIKDEDMDIDNDFIMRKTGALWQVFDILIDGASLTEDYRSQFNKIVLENGIDGNEKALFPRLRKAIQEDKDEWKKSKKKTKKEEIKREEKKRPTLLEK